MNRGNVYLNAQMPEKALPDLEKALNMPKLKDKKLTRGSLATAQLNVGKYREALDNYNIVIDKEKVKIIQNITTTEAWRRQNLGIIKEKS